VRIGDEVMSLFVDLNETATKKERFYALASKAELTEWRAKARFRREPYHLTEMRKRKEIENASYGSTGIETDN
jgi:hypothetical protein